MIKIEHLPDSRFLPDPSIFANPEQPLLTGTVHHHPQHYQVTIPNYTITQDSQIKLIPPITTTIKTEPIWNEEQCPNVDIRKAVSSTAKMDADNAAGMPEDYNDRELRTMETTVERRYGTTPLPSVNGFQVYPSPSLDYQSTQVSRLQQKRQLFFTQKRLEPIRRKLQRMSVNLDSLIPREDLAASHSAMFDPAAMSGMLFSPDLAGQKALFAHSMDLEGEISLQELINCDDPGMAKSFYGDGDMDKIVFEAQNFTPLTPASDFGSQDGWINSCTSLPPTPEGTSPNSPTGDMYSQTTPTSVLLSHPQVHPSPPVPTVTPLTPDSLTGSMKDEDQQFREILSFLKESEVAPVLVKAIGANQFNDFQLPLGANYDQHTSLSSPGNCSSTCSSYMSTPQSPLSPNMQPSPDSGVFHSFSPQPDNLQTLLMSAPPPLASAPLSSASLSHGPEVPQPNTVVDAANVRKDCSRKRARSSSRAPPPQRKRGVSTANRKDRKKEQNKTAALRYRQKKREEKNSSEDRLQVFEDKNRQLKNAVASLEAEIGYLTNLWKEVEKARMAR